MQGIYEARGGLHLDKCWRRLCKFEVGEVLRFARYAIHKKKACACIRAVATANSPKKSGIAYTSASDCISGQSKFDPVDN